MSLARLLADDALDDPEVKALAGKVVILGIDIHGAHDRLASPYSLPIFGAPKEFMVITLLAAYPTNGRDTWRDLRDFSAERNLILVHPEHTRPKVPPSARTTPVLHRS